MAAKSHDLSRKVLDYLRNSSGSLTALQVSKGIGLSTAKEVNPTLYALEKQGLAQRTTDGRKVSWQCVRSSPATNSEEIKVPENRVLKEEYACYQEVSKDDVHDQLNEKPMPAENANVPYDMDQDVEMEPLQEEEGPKKQLHEVHEVYHRKRAHDSVENNEDMSPSFSIPKPPHQILKPVGARTAFLAEALRRETERQQPTEWVPREARDHPQSFHDMMDEVAHQVLYDAPHSRPSGIQASTQSSAEIHMQPLMGMGREMFDQGGSEPEERMIEKIIAFLKQFNRPVSTLEIARAVNRKTKREVNPTLYGMEKRGIIVKTTVQPPAWKLNTFNSSNSSFQSSQHTQRSSDIVQRSGSQTEAQYRENNPPGPRPNLYDPNSRARQLSWPGEEDTHPAKSLDVGLSADRHSMMSQSTSMTEAQTHCELSSMTFTALNKNPVSAINEYAQRSHTPLSFELIHEGKSKENRFVVAVKLGDRMYNAVSAGNMKDAKKEAADVALREILGRQEVAMLDSQPKIGSVKSMTHFDAIAMLSVRTFMTLSNEVQDKFAGRKVIAAIIKRTYEDETGVVVSVGSGNRCITGDRLTLDGKTLNDSHAEIICRRAFLLYLYSELEKFYSNKQSIFEAGGLNGKLQTKDGITWHLFISTAPCGDGALFTPRESSQTYEGTASRDHAPLYTSKQQGLLRTKVEDGEGTIPVDSNDGPQTWDGILRGNRLRTMSCTDKICKWNVLGMQGALLSHIIEPIYLESLTLGYLYEHGHLSRAVCCRLSKDSDINEKLPLPYSLNHPWLGRVTSYSPSRETQKTNNLSVNWFLGGSGIELTDGRSGAGLTRTGCAPTPSRLCKAELYKHFKSVCSKQQHLQPLTSFETYREAKEKSLGFQEAKAVMNEQFRNLKFGSWVKKPRELEMFDV